MRTDKEVIRVTSLESQKLQPHLSVLSHVQCLIGYGICSLKHSLVLSGGYWHQWKLILKYLNYGSIEDSIFRSLFYSS